GAGTDACGDQGEGVEEVRGPTARRRLSPINKRGDNSPTSRRALDDRRMTGRHFRESHPSPVVPLARPSSGNSAGRSSSTYPRHHWGRCQGTPEDWRGLNTAR
ncbi:MAG: hypothetical protein ABGY24_15940, partial [bacterium]